MIAKSLACLCVFLSLSTFSLADSDYAQDSPELFEKVAFSLDSGTDVTFAANGSVITIAKNGIDVIILGEEGLISIGRLNDPDRVNLTMNAIQELDSNNIAITEEGHSIDLSNAAFEVGALFSTRVDGVKATAANMSTTLLDNSQLILTVLMLEEDGRIVTGADSHDGSAGSVKILADVVDWPFCTNGGSGAANCGNNEIGDNLEVSMNINTLNRAIRRFSNTGLAIGNDRTTLYYPREARINGDLQELESNYPIINTVNNSSELLFGIPRFNSSGLLELAVIMNDDATPTLNQRTVNVKNVQLKADESNGALLFAPKKSKDNVQSILASIREVDVDGNQVGVDGLGAIAQHNRSSLAASSFQVSDVFDTKIGNASAKAVNMTTNLVGDSVLRVIAMIFTKSNTISIGDETFNVDTQTMKYNIEIDNWAFCENNGQGANKCNGNDVGDALELEIEIQGFNSVLQSAGNNTFTLNGDADVILSSQVSVDGDIIPMQEGFPRVEVRDDRSFIVLRFPKFDNNLVYDPLVRLNKVQNSGAASVFGMSVVLGAIMGLLALFF